MNENKISEGQILPDENTATTGRDLIYELDGRPPLKTAIPLGMQHVMSMFTGNIAPILILSQVANLDAQVTLMLTQCAMLVSGFVTLLQLYPIRIGKVQIGSGLPIVMGTSFVFVPTMKNVAGSEAMQMGLGAPGVFGASLLGAIVELFMGIFIKPLKKLFPPVVIGVVLLTIGMGLLKTGAGYFAGGGDPYLKDPTTLQYMLSAAGDKIPNPDYGSVINILLASEVFLLIMLLQKFAKGMLKSVAVLIGILVGYVTAVVIGLVSGISLIDFQSVGAAPWFMLPKPFAAGLPTFNFQAFLSFALVYIVLGLETLGNTSGVAMAVANREATATETSGSIMANAIGSAAGAVFNSMPNTAFAQNVGILQMTRVINKFCVACGAIFLILAGFLPKIGAAFLSIPQSVLGGALITIFAMITINGIRMLATAGFSQGNILVLSVSLGVGYGVSMIPEVVQWMPGVIQFIFHDSVTAVALLAVLSNLLFNGLNSKDAMKS